MSRVLEGVSFAANRAFEQITGDPDSFLAAGRQHQPEPGRVPEIAGEDFNFDDDQQMRRRVPRLSALCLSWY